jgi:hypothetical protein
VPSLGPPQRPSPSVGSVTVPLLPALCTPNSQGGPGAGTGIEVESHSGEGPAAGALQPTQPTQLGLDDAIPRPPTLNPARPNNHGQTTAGAPLT